MEILFVFFVLLPVVAVVQLLGSVIRYIIKGRPIAYYKNIEKYFRIVLLYFVFALIYRLSQNSFWYEGNSIWGIVFWIFGFIVIPTGIAIYYVNIVYHEYPVANGLTNEKTQSNGSAI